MFSSFLKRQAFLILAALVLGMLLWVAGVFVWVILDDGVSSAQERILQVDAVTQWVLAFTTVLLALTGIFHAQANGRTVRLMEEAQKQVRRDHRRDVIFQMVATATEAVARCGIFGEAQGHGLKKILPSNTLNTLTIAGYTQATESLAATARALTQVRFHVPDLTDRSAELFDLVNESYAAATEGRLDEMEDRAARIHELGEELRKEVDAT